MCKEQTEVLQTGYKQTTTDNWDCRKKIGSDFLSIQDFRTNPESDKHHTLDTTGSNSSPLIGITEHCTPKQPGHSTSTKSPYLLLNKSCCICCFVLSMYFIYQCTYNILSHFHISRHLFVSYSFHKLF